MMAPMISIFSLPWASNRSAKALHMGLKRLAVIAGKKSIPLMCELPALVMGVRILPLVPDSNMRGVTPA